MMTSPTHPPTSLRLPLPPLPSWLVTASLLSYYGYQYQAWNLLQLLSKDARAYARSHHRSQLEHAVRFLRRYNPRLKFRGAIEELVEHRRPVPPPHALG